MGKTHPIELRERVIRYVNEGYSHRQTAKLLLVSVKFVNDMVRLNKMQGHVYPKKQGRKEGDGKLSKYHEWLKKTLLARPDMTLDELTACLLKDYKVSVHRSAIGYLLKRLGYSHKKKRFMPKSKDGQM